MIANFLIGWIGFDMVLETILIQALKEKYQAEILCAKANIEVYLKNPAGIGDHPDIISAMDQEVTKLSTAEDKLDSLSRIFDNDNVRRS